MTVGSTVTNMERSLTNGSLQDQDAVLDQHVIGVCADRDPVAANDHAMLLRDGEARLACSNALS